MLWTCFYSNVCSLSLPIGGLFLICLTVSETARSLGYTSSGCFKKLQGVREEIWRLVTFCPSVDASSPTCHDNSVSTAPPIASLYWPFLVPQFSACFSLSTELVPRIPILPYFPLDLPSLSPILILLLFSRKHLLIIYCISIIVFTAFFCP